MAAELLPLLQQMVDWKASDLHLSVGEPPHLRIDERLLPLEQPPLTNDVVWEMVTGIAGQDRMEKFKREWELDFSFGVEKLARFRINVFLQRGHIGVAIRALPERIRTFEECGLPTHVMMNLCRRPRGLVLVTGATGSGKSTTMASMVDWINNERPCHIITIEDPIEYVHHNKRALIDQREVDADTRSFGGALKHVLRQDPNVILIGEMRDLETIEAALNIAETGHLVFATLHTSDSIQTMNRIIDVFPAHAQNQVRVQLSFVLLAIFAQQLIPMMDGRGRVLAAEVLLANHAARALLRESKLHQLYSVIQTSQREGMRTMNQAFYELVKAGKISIEEARARSTDVEDLDRLFQHG